jgi:hypothetical protein
MTGPQETMPASSAVDPGVQDDFSASAPKDTRADTYTGTHRERRLHLHAFDYWHGLKEGRTFPLFKSLTPEGLSPFRDNCLLLELRGADAVIRFVGDRIALMFGTAVEKGALLSSFADSRFAAALLEQFASAESRARAAEFEFTEDTLRSRGVFLPFSQTGDQAHFSMVVANHRHYGRESEVPETTETTATTEAAPAEETAASPAEEAADASPEQALENAVAEDRMPEEPAPEELTPEEPAPEELISGGQAPDEPAADGLTGIEAPTEVSAEAMAEAPDEGDPFEDSIKASRAAAQSVAHLDGGGRSSLYQALAAALALYEQAQADPAAFRQTLAASGLKMQARAPFTPALKLTFGRDYDKTRLTEYAAALAYAVRKGETADTLAAFLEKEPGGIKGCVRRERTARRGDSSSAAARLQAKASAALAALPAARLADMTSDNDFCLLIARRAKDGGGLEVVGPADVGRNTVDAAVRRLADKTKK